MSKCLFGHKCNTTMRFFEEPPKPRSILEVALSYDVCTRCGKVKTTIDQIDELNHRIKRSKNESRKD